MKHLRNLVFAVLILSISAQKSGADAEKKDESEEKKAVEDSAFEKRQGLVIDDSEDQLAMESNHQDQIQIESARDQIAVETQPQHGHQIPMPVPMRVIPGNIVFPMPPGFGQQQGQGHGGPPQGVPIGLRAPPPPGFHGQGQQGQFSQHHPTHQAPSPNFQPGPNFIPPHMQHQQQRQNQQQQQIIMQQSTPGPGAGEIRIQKANSIPHGDVSSENQSGRGQKLQHGSLQQQQNQLFQFFQAGQKQQNPGNSGEIKPHPTHQPAGLVPPLPPRFQGPVRGDHVHPAKNHGFSSAEITKNLIRELFDRKPPGFKNGQPNGGFFAPPQQQPQQGASQAKVMNRPVQRPVKPIGLPGGGLLAHGKEVALSTNDLNAEGGEAPAFQYGGPSPFSGGPEGAFPSGPDGDQPKIASLEVKCEKNVMRVFVAFDKPFYGVIFSKGHYHNVNCVHLPAGLGHTSANFDISIDACGMQGNSENGMYGYGIQSGSGSFFENTIVIQYDSQVQEVWDQARKLRCTWHDQYEKSVTFRPFPVEQLDVVRADFAGDNVGCWMQIQVGRGPWAAEVSGLVKIGQTMTMVLAIKDDDNKFDMMVRNCQAHDGQRAPIQLVDQWGCITRPKLMSPFTKIKNFGASATVLSYAHFQSFKFPDENNVHFQCTIQICRHQCPEQCTQPGEGASGGSPTYGIGKSGLPAERDESTRRRRRSPGFNDTNDLPEEEVFEYQTTFKADFSNEKKEDVGLNKVITVISPNDLQTNGESEDEGVPIVEANGGDLVCMSTLGFAAMIVLLIGLLLIACIISAVIVIKKRPHSRKSY